MKIKAVLFDLDGTLLPFEQDDFVKAYFGGLSTKLYPLGYNPKELVSAIWKSTDAMITNDGTMLNEERFWNSFSEIFGERVLADKPFFDEYYKNEFQQVKNVCKPNGFAAEIIKKIKEKGYKIILATNPIFPSIATESRIRWAGLKADDFNLYTTYENSKFCKPNLKYYTEITDKIGIAPEECLMIGNDVGEDMVAMDIGMQVFLLTDNLINKNNIDISVYPHGNYADLESYLKNTNIL